MEKKKVKNKKKIIKKTDNASFSATPEENLAENLKSKTFLFICECSSREHQIVVERDVEDNLIYCHIHLSVRPFWKRLKYGLKYIFGYHCRYGHWDEFIWKPEHADKLQELSKLLKQK